MEYIELGKYYVPIDQCGMITKRITRIVDDYDEEKKRAKWKRAFLFTVKVKGEELESKLFETEESRNTALMEFLAEIKRKKQKQWGIRNEL